MADLPTPQQVANLPDDDLISNIIAIKSKIKNLSSLLDAYLDGLSSRVADGLIDPTFNHNDWSFVLNNGRRSWSYPESVTSIEQKLKAAESAAQADGTAIAKRGNKFWTIKEPSQ